MTQPVSPQRRNWTLAILCLVAVLSYVDRQVFTLFQDDIKAELSLTDGQLGLLTGMSFALFYTLAAFPIARYADRGDRRLVVAVCVSVWSTATALCGLAQSYWQMILARVGLAAGEAGANPASNSLAIEIFPPDRRGSVIATILAANAVGISGGLALGGWLSRYFHWREVFLILGLPGLVLAVVTLKVCAEPRTGGGATIAAAQPTATWEAVRIMAGNTSLRWVALLLSMVPLTGFALILWAPSFFQRVHGLGKEATGIWLGGALGAGLVLGNLFAGWVVDRFGKPDLRFNGWFAGVGLLAAFPCALGFAYASNAYASLACYMMVKFLMTLHLGPIMALSFAQVPASLRATVSATITMFMGLSGTGIGGTAAGFASQAFAKSYGDLSLRPALALLSCCLVIGGIAAIMAGRTARPHPESG